MEAAGMDIPHPDDVFVAGAWVAGSGGRRAIVSPATEEVVAEVALPSSTDAAAAVEAARTNGLSKWASTTVAERVEVVRRFCDLLEAQLRPMEAVWAAEAGMPIRYSRTLHKFGAVGAWTTLLASATDVLAEQRRESPLGPVTVSREPAGVVVGIMSYNGPLVTVASKIIPALLAGCPVIVKGALESQLILRLVAECASQAGFPAGALSILCGDADLGQRLTADPDVDMVSLTGGRVAAQAIIDATRGRFARTHLELGGKSPALILDDAPLDSVLRSLVPGATSGTGQVCALLSRVIVPRRRHDEILTAMRDAWNALVIGDPLEPKTQIGPLISQAAVDRSSDFIARATSEGAEIVAGGRRPEGFAKGWYFEPTLVTGVDHESYLAQNEVFGPVTAVLTYEDEAEGLRLANETSYGLAATVYSGDRDRGEWFARQIRAGSVAVNTYGPTLTAPFGGMKGSGWGREAGPEGILEFTELKQIVVAP